MEKSQLELSRVLLRRLCAQGLITEPVRAAVMARLEGADTPEELTLYRHHNTYPLRQPRPRYARAE